MFAVKACIRDLLASPQTVEAEPAEVRSPQQQAAGGRPTTSSKQQVKLSGIACDRVWVQGYVTKVSHKTGAIWLTEDGHTVKITTRTMKPEVLVTINDYLQVIGSCKTAAPPGARKTGSAAPAQSAASGGSLPASEATQPGAAGTTTTTTTTTTPEAIAAPSVVISAHKILVLSHPHIRAKLWSQEVAYLNSQVYPLIAARQLMEKLKHISTASQPGADAPVNPNPMTIDQHHPQQLQLNMHSDAQPLGLHEPMEAAPHVQHVVETFHKPEPVAVGQQAVFNNQPGASEEDVLWSTLSVVHNTQL